jgi:hypothetical protein
MSRTGIYILLSAIIYFVVSSFLRPYTVKVDDDLIFFILVTIGTLHIIIDQLKNQFKKK